MLSNVNLTIFAEANIALPLTKLLDNILEFLIFIVSVNFNSPENLINNIDSGRTSRFIYFSPY